MLGLYLFDNVLLQLQALPLLYKWLLVFINSASVRPSPSFQPPWEWLFGHGHGSVQKRRNPGEHQLKTLGNEIQAVVTACPQRH